MNSTKEMYNSHLRQTDQRGPPFYINCHFSKGFFNTIKVRVNLLCDSEYVPSIGELVGGCLGLCRVPLSRTKKKGVGEFLLLKF